MFEITFIIYRNIVTIVLFSSSKNKKILTTSQILEWENFQGPLVFGFRIFNDLTTDRNQTCDLLLDGSKPCVNHLPDLISQAWGFIWFVCKSDFQETQEVGQRDNELCKNSGSGYSQVNFK